ncbi:MAG: Calx-beta domain-containing protein [Candidatus Uhrbacteria bacterium]
MTLSGNYTQSGGTFTGGAATATFGGAFSLSGGTFNAGSSTKTFTGAFSMSGGAFNGDSATLDFNNSFTINNAAATFTSTSGTLTFDHGWSHTAGTFNHNNGTVKWDGSGVGSYNFDVNSSEDFYNLVIDCGGASACASDYVVITSPDSLNITHDLYLTDGQIIAAVGATLNAKGDIYITDSYSDSNNGPSTLYVNGTSAQNITSSGTGILYGHHLSIANTTGVSLGSNISLTGYNSRNLDLSGTLDLNGYNLSVNATTTVSSGGNLRLKGGETFTGTAPTLSAGSTVTYDGAAGPYSIKDWTYTSATLAINGGASSVFNFGSTETVTNLTITQGILSLNGYSPTVSSTFSNNDTLRLKGSETPSLTMDTDSGTVQFVGDADSGADSYTVTTLSPTYYNLTINSTDGATDTFALGSAVDINNTFTLTAGTFDVSASDYAMTVGGNFAKTGTFTARSGTVTFDDVTKTSVISGATSFYGLRSVTPDKNIQFTASVTQTVTGALTFTGSADHLIVLRSTSDGTRWGLTLSGTQSVAYVDVKDSDASGGTQITPSASTNSLNNLNWSFETIEVNWTATSQSASESAGTMTVTAQLSLATALDVTVPFTVTGTATGGGTDYSITASPITITAGNTTADITITIVSDSVDEANETVIVTMGDPTNATKGLVDVHTATINDDDDPPSIAVADVEVAEGIGTATVTVTMTGTSYQSVSVNYATSNGTAVSGSDYTSASSTLTWTAGQTGAKTFNVSISDDSLDENNETVNITLSDVVNGTISDSAGVLTITDNDDLPTVAWTSSSQAESEGGDGSMTVTAQLSAVSGRDVSVPFTVTGTATGSGTDYSITASPITITAGQTTSNITITITNDVVDEANETVIVTMDDPTNATKGATTVHTATINDNDDIPTVSFTASSQAESEGGDGTMTVTAELSATSGLDVTVPFEVTGTAAGSGTDYSITVSPITITAGNTTADIIITITNDTIDEANETVIVTMGSPTNATQGATTVHTATINDNDDPPVVTVTSTSQSKAESAGTASITVQIDAVSGLNVSVPFTLSGTAATPADYTITVSPVTITAGQTTTTITYTIIDDALDESSETAIVTLGTPTNGTLGTDTVHTLTITDNDDAPTVSFTASSQAESEGGDGTMIVTAELSAASGLDVTVPFEITGTATGSGTDYSITASPITITAGNTTADITITITNDTIDEANETVIVTMGSPTNATQGTTTVHTATINDNDDPPTVAVADVEVSEGVGTATVTVTMTGSSYQSVSVDYATSDGTAVAGSDYTSASSTLTWTAGQTGAKTFNVTIADDSDYEPSETVNINLSNVVNGTISDEAGVLTITNNDDPPTVSWTASSHSSAESAGTMTVTAQLSAVSGFNAIIPFTLSGTAIENTDYSITATPITITAGNTTANITITITDDALDEANETVILTMGSPTNATQGATTVHTATVNDNDATPTVTFTASSQSAAESAGTMTVTAQLSAVSGRDVIVPFTMTGTATGGGTDYSITVSPITITAGNTTANITITITNDLLDEANETVIITMGVPTNADQGTTTVHTATINDNDDTPTVAWTTSSQSASEAAGTMTVTAELSAASGLDITVPFTLSGTATLTDDFSPTSSPITITAGSTTSNITITIVNDIFDENNETVVVTMGSPTNATQGTTIEHTATINDNEDPPVVSWTVASQSGDESAGTMTVTATLSEVSNLDVTVPYTLTGTATGSGTDYSITASPIIIESGNLTAAVTVTLVDDLIDELNETVIVTIGDPTNATRGAAYVHTVTINDNDASPSLAIADNSVAEDGGSVTVTVTMTGVSSQTVSVDYSTSNNTAVAGSDYTNKSGTLTWTAGQTGDKTFTVSITEDALDEENETFVISLSNVSNGTISDSSATITINDNDNAPTVAWTSSSQSGDEDVGTFTVTAQLSAVSGKNVSIPFTLSGTATNNGTDYSSTASPITITAGSTTANITLTIVNDVLPEANETIVVTMGNPTNATKGVTTVHTATVNDNDATPTVTFTTASQSAVESAGTMTVTAQLSAASGLDITVPFTLSGTAIENIDYSITATPITITAGNTTADITITITDDALDEANETVILTMGSPTNATQGATTVHTATINDNDATPTVTFTASSQSAAESAGTMTVTAQLSAVSGRDVSVPFTVTGTATGSGTDYSITATPITITAGNTTADITITITNDLLDEANETVILTMGSPTNATQGITTVHTATINDNDDAPTVSFTTSSQAESEGGDGTMTITTELSAASGLDITVPFTVTGTATGSGTDYSITATPITITAGNTTADITITITNDALDEANETVIVTMGSLTNATQGTTTVHTATINDDDDVPTVVWTVGSQSAAESAGTMTVTAQLSFAYGLDVAVPFTVTGTATGSGNDYSITASPITITAGSTTANITVSIVDDFYDEANETVIVTMGDPTNATKGTTTVHTATINDNDETPTVAWTASSQAESESGDGTMTITAQLSFTSAFDVTIPFTLTGTATGSGTDYSITASPSTITAGNTTADITITITNDTLDENNETVIVTMGDPTNATQGATTVHTATINDDDETPTVTFTTSSQSAAESVGTMTITAELSAVSGRDVLVPYTLTGTATGSGTDYSITVSPITVTAGNTTADITITITNDTLDENNETVIVTMGSPTNATQGATTVHTATINDNDDTPTVSFTASSQSAVESAGTMTITAELSAVSSLGVVVPYTLTGTATGSGTDYSITTTPITITAGQTTADITITITNDTLDENNETVIVTMGSPTNATQGTTTVHTATIEDNDATPTVAWTASSQTAAETVGTMTVTAQLSAASGLEVSVPFTVTGTAAGSGNDYSITASPITITAGQTTANITISVVDDLLDEANETVIVTMGSPTNATQGTTTVHTATINDNEGSPEVYWSASSQSAAENAGVMTVTAELSAASGLDVIVPFTITGTATGSGTDYSITASPITITAGNTTADITITTTNDTLDETNETVIVTMGLPTNATQGTPTVHTATINDNDNPPTVSWTVVSQDADESENIIVTAQISALSSFDVTVPFTISGTAIESTDYTITASPITILAGQNTAQAIITVTDDVPDEVNETIVLTIGDPTNATKGATTEQTAVILDNDSPPTVSWTTDIQSAAESTGTITVTAQLSAVSGKNISIPYTLTGTAAGSGTDYSITASPISITAGSTTANVTITITNDVLDEDNETVIVTLGDPTNASRGLTSVHTATIEDNDEMPVVSFTSASQSGSEAAGTLTLVAEISAVSGRGVSIPFTVTGTATGSGEDYSVTTSPITMAAGQTTAEITINLTDDSYDELDETVIITMGNPTNATNGAATVHTATIEDNDPTPLVNWTISSQTFSENGNEITLTAELSGASDLTVSIPFTLSGIATGDGADYSISASPLVINPRQTSVNITITITDDILDEANETVIVTIGNPINALIGTTTVHTLTITDNDDPPTVSFTTASQSAAESTNMTITAQLSTVSSFNVSLPFTVTGTATGSETDYSITTSPITITAGSTTADITITVIDDDLDENNETVIITMGNPTNATKGAITVHTATINDNDEAPTVAWTSVSQFVAESVGSFNLMVQASAISGRDITVPFTINGTAVGSGTDYTILESSVTILTGETTANVSVSIIDDAIDEINETIVITMGDPTNATKGASTVHTINITDNDPPPSIVVSDIEVSEGIGTAAVTVTMTGTSSRSVSVDYLTSDDTALSGSDYTATSGTLTWTAGQTGVKTFNVSIINDTIDENNETLNLTLSNVVNGTISDSAAILTITDNDDPPVVSVTATSQSKSESAGTATVTVQLNTVSGLDVTIPFTLSGTATNNTDYSITASPVTILAGQTTTIITYTITDDVLDEANETAIVTLGAPTNGTLGTDTIHALTITDNDDPPTVTVTATSQSKSEETETATVTVQLNTASGLDVTIPFALSGTAINETDYTITASPVTITAGQTTTTITYTITDDVLDEANETAIVTLVVPTNGTLGSDTVHALTITDNDDPPTVSWTASSQSANEDAGTMTVTAELSTVSGKDISIPFTLSGTATGSGADYSIVASPIIITAGNTTADITITLINDILDEANETIIVTMDDPTNATKGDTTVHTATITDNDDPPIVTVSSTSQSKSEETETATVTVQLNTASGLDVTIPFTLSGTATNNTDYSITASPVTISAGQTTTTITYTVTDDVLDEAGETAIVTLGAPTNGTLGSDTVHTLTITDNDDSPTVAWTASSQLVDESTNSITVTAQLSVVSGLDVSIPFSVTGTATGGGTDYSISASPITIIAGQTTANIVVSPVNDLVDEINETIIVTMGEPVNAIQGATTIHTATINDDDATPTITIEDKEVVESEDSVLMTLNLTGVSSRDISVDYSTTDGTAVTGDDYIETTGTVTWLAGQTGEKTFEILVIDDLLDEETESLNLLLANSVNAEISDASASLTITDNDDIPTVVWSSLSQEVDEGVDEVVVTVELSAVSGLDITIPFALTGTAINADYSVTASPITITAGQASANIVVAVVDDALDENNETIILTMGNPTNANKDSADASTVSVFDNDDPPTVSWSASTQNADEDSETMTVTAELSTVSGLGVTIPFVVSGSSTATGSGTDYSITASPIIITAGQTTAEITINLTDDSLDENNETVILTMGDPTNATLGVVTTHTATINDNDALPVVNWGLSTQEVDEDEETATVSAAITAVSGLAVVLSWELSGTAASGTDFSIEDELLTIPAGSLTAEFSINITDDFVDENSETIILEMTGIENATAGQTTQTITIEDNDSAALTVTESSGSTVVSEVGFTDSFLVALSSEPLDEVSVLIETNGQTSVSLSNLTFTSANWSTPQEITVLAVDDDIAEGDHNDSIRIISASDDTLYDNLEETFSVEVSDNDTAGVAVSAISGDVSEGGGSATFEVVLTSQPTFEVIISFESSDETEGEMDPMDIFFTPEDWNVPQTITVTGADDFVDDGDQGFDIVLLPAVSEDGFYQDYDPGDVDVINLDNDTAGITLTESGDSTAVTEDGLADSYTLSLDSQPLSDVTVSWSFAGNDIVLIESTFVFTPANWNQTQAVFVEAVDDQIDEEDSKITEVVNLVVSADGLYNNLEVPNVSVAVSDNDTAVIILTESDAFTEVRENGFTDSFTLVLNSEPTANVVIALSPDAQVAADQATVTFTSANWNLPQTVVVSAIDDNDNEMAAHEGILSFTVTSEDAFYNEMALESLAVTVRDNDGGSSWPTEPTSGSGWSSTSSQTTFTNPTTGTILTAEQTVTLSWTSTNYSNFVNLLWSLDGGSTFDVLANWVPNYGYYLWTVPNVVSDSVVLKIQITDLATISASATVNVKIEKVVEPIEEVPEETTEAPNEEDNEIEEETPDEETEDLFMSSTLEKTFGERWLQDFANSGLSETGFPNNVPLGSLVKLPDDGNPNTQYDAAVYYVGSDYRRHPFPSEAVYESWFSTFYGIVILDPQTMARIPVGPLVTYRPGSRLVKFEASPRVYFVDASAGLRWITSEKLVRQLYGENWNKLVDDISDTFWTSYHFNQNLVVINDQNWNNLIFTKRRVDQGMEWVYNNLNR